MLAALSRAAVQGARIQTRPAAMVAMRGMAVEKSVLDDIDKKVKSNDLVLFMKGTPEQPMCGYSRAVVQIFEAQGLEKYESVNVLADQNIREGIKEYSSWPTIPQIFVKGEFIGGADIMLEMFKSGELDKVLKKNKLIPE